jgi:AcrR family transcriptional regulator
MARPRQISDEQILAAARRAVLAGGPSVPLHEIASKLGVTEPALLKRFGSRTELMIAALRPPDDPPWAEWLQALPDDRPFVEQLVEILGTMLSFLSEAVPCLAVLRESGIPHDRILDPRRPAPLRAVQAVMRYLERARDRGLIASDRVEDAAIALVGAVQSRAFLKHLLRKNPFDSSDDEHIRALAHLFAKALGSSQDSIERSPCSVAHAPSLSSSPPPPRSSSPHASGRAEIRPPRRPRPRPPRR